MVVPHGSNYMDGGISHSTPWPYTQDVPMLWYGPGHIKAQGSVRRGVTSADIAPTIARLIGFDAFRAPDGRAMTEALVPGVPAPKLVVVLVVDGGGRFVHDLWPGSWPYLRSLMPKGTWYENATVGSNPSNTAPIHATIGTGAFPRRHGVVDNVIRFPDGVLASPYDRGPRQALLVDGLANQYLQAAAPDAIVGMVGSSSWHLGMIGWGDDTGGPQPLAAVKTSATGKTAPGWGLPPSVSACYRFPAYVNDAGVCPPLEHFWHVADDVDGAHDGRWRGHDIASMRGGFDTPARIPYQEAAVEAVIGHEGFGRHSATDLLFLNFKLVDEIGHLFYASAIEMKDALSVQDRQLQQLVNYLERNHHGEYVLLATADHGHSAAPSVSGSFGIGVRKVSARAQRLDRDANGVPLVELVRPTWVDIDMDELQSNGATLEDVSHALASLTKGQTAPHAVRLSPGEAAEKVFDAVFASSLLTRLPCLPEAAGVPAPAPAPAPPAPPGMERPLPPEDWG